MKKNIQLLIGGDLFPTPINEKYFIEGDIDFIFDKEILELFDRADFSICNLEGCFTNEQTKEKLKFGPNIRASKESILAIKKLGVDCVSLANNHATDYGIQGLNDTVEVLTGAGIDFFGAGENKDSITSYYIVTISNMRIVFYGVSETCENTPTATKCGVNIYDEYRICKEIQKLKKENDIVVVMYHGGVENIHYCTNLVRERFHRLADNGADIIISQHTHAVGEEEWYNGSYLLYGQGNFCFHFSKKNYEWTSTALLLYVTINDEGMKIDKHLVRREGPRVVYDKNQDLSSFYERSKRLQDGDEFLKELDELAEEKLLSYLRAFRGKNLIDRIVRKISPQEKYASYLKSRFTQKQILQILLAMQGEEYRDISATGLKNMLDESIQ